MRRLAVALTASVALLHVSCSDASGPGNQENDRISITNDAGVLAIVAAGLGGLKIVQVN